MKKILYIYLLFLLVATTSCYKDLGNYDYNRLPELQVEGISEDYGSKILYKDSLIIEPKIIFGNEDASNFNAVWYIIEDTLRPIANTIDLRILPNESGLVKYMFEIEHKELGLAYRAQTQVIYTSGLERGFYIMKETEDGNTEIDGHIRQGIETYDLYPDMLTKQLGRPMEGKPIGLDYWDWMNPDPKTGDMTKERVLRPASEKEILTFRMNDFSCQAHTEDLFFDVNAGDLNIESIKSIPGTSLIIYNNGKVRSLPNENEVSRFMMEYNGEYHLNPNICSADKGSVIVYDELTSSFKSIRGGTTQLFPQGDKGMGWGRPSHPMNNLDSDLKFMGRTLGVNQWDPGTGYALLAKKGKSDALYLNHIMLRMYQGNMDSPNWTNITKIDTLTSKLNVCKGERFCMHEYEKLLFYTIGNRVFSYNILTGQESPVIAESDYPTGKVPTEITYMKYVRCLYDEDPYNFDRLFIGGYNNGSYVLLAYSILGGKVNGEPMIFEGTGKIKDIRYTTPVCKVKDLFFWQ